MFTTLKMFSLEGSDLTGWLFSVSSAWPVSARWESSRILNSTCTGIAIECNFICSGVAWLYCMAPSIKRAAQFCTFWSSSICFRGSRYSSVLPTARLSIKQYTNITDTLSHPDQTVTNTQCLQLLSWTEHYYFCFWVVQLQGVCFHPYPINSRVNVLLTGFHCDVNLRVISINMWHQVVVPKDFW